jgi:ankyrin repeat protein
MSSWGRSFARRAVVPSLIAGALVLPAALLAQDGSAEALLKASGKGDLGAVQALLQQGVSPNAANDKGYTGLMEAARTGKLEVVDALIKAGAEVNARSKDGSTAALRAVFGAQADTLERLVKAGADVKLANAKGETPFQYAVGNATANVRPEIIAALRKGGVDVRSETVRGEPALVYAISSLQEKTVAALLNAGADPNVKNAKGRPAVVLVAERAEMADHAKMMAALIAAGVDVNARDERGRSALEVAVDVAPVDYKNEGNRKNAATVVYMLASRGADGASVSAARELAIKKTYVTFDTTISQGVSAAARKGTAPQAGASSAAPGRTAAASVPLGKPSALDTPRFKTMLPAGWEVAADDLERMGMMTVQRKGSGGAEGVYFKFEGPNWQGTPEKEIASFAQKEKGTPPEKVVVNGIEFFRTSYEAFGTRQTMLIAKQGTTKVTLTVLGDAAGPAVRTILDALVLK